MTARSRILSKPAGLLMLAAALMATGCQGRSPAPAAAHSPQPAGSSSGAASTTGNAGGSPAARPKSACPLVTEQELSALLGADPGPGTEGSDGDRVGCTYSGAGFVSVIVDHGDKTLLDQFCSATTTTQQVPGVADGACLTIVGGGPVAAMYVLKGSELLSINIQAGSSTRITPAALTAVGTQAAGRL
jgi:hypothetical protein